MVLKLRAKNLDAVAIASILSAFEGAVFVSKQVDTIELRIPEHNLDKVFASLERAKSDKTIINYSIAQMTLREVSSNLFFTFGNDMESSIAARCHQHYTC